MIITTRDQDALQFVCPSARDAVVRYCQTNLMSSIEILASDELTKWRAFELFFAAQFLREKLLRLPNQGITRVVRSSQALVELQTTRFRRMLFPSDDESPIEPGTFVVPDTRGHNFASIDFFAFSLNGLRFFIQLSQSHYSQHASKIESLFEKREYLEGKSTFEFFAERTGLPTSVRSKSKKAAASKTWFFVYLCNKVDNTSHREIDKKHKERLIYLTKRELQSLGGEFQHESLYA